VAAVDRRAFRVRTVFQALHDDRWVTDITGSLSALGLQQYLLLWERIQAFNLEETAPGRFLWKWTPSNQYLASSTYHAFFIGQTGVLGVKEVHKARAPPVCKFFAWLAFLGHC
jgi:hypothetical protein